MKGNGAAVTISKDARMAAIKSVQSKWDVEVDKACGKPLADNIRALFAKHAP